MTILINRLILTTAVKIKTPLITSSIIAMFAVLVFSAIPDGYAGSDDNCTVIPQTHSISLYPGESTSVSTQITCTSFSNITNIVADTSNCGAIVSNNFGARLHVASSGYIQDTYNNHTITYNGNNTPNTVSCDIIWSTQGDAIISTTQTIMITVNDLPPPEFHVILDTAPAIMRVDIPTNFSYTIINDAPIPIECYSNATFTGSPLIENGYAPPQIIDVGSVLMLNFTVTYETAFGLNWSIFTQCTNMQQPFPIIGTDIGKLTGPNPIQVVEPRIKVGPVDFEYDRGDQSFDIIVGSDLTYYHIVIAETPFLFDDCSTYDNFGNNSTSNFPVPSPGPGFVGPFTIQNVTENLTLQVSGTCTDQFDVEVSDTGEQMFTVVQPTSSSYFLAGTLIEDIEVLELPRGTTKSLVSLLTNLQSVINGGVINGAVSTLDNTVESIDKIDDDPCDMIQSVINKIEAQSGKKIDEFDANDLIEKAEFIQELLECNTD